jgi:hypothetical protein
MMKYETYRPGQPGMYADTVGRGAVFRPLIRAALGSGRSAPPAFPVALLGPEWARWCQAHAETRSAPVDYVSTALLTAAASLIGNARWASVNPEWREPCCLWAVVVGGPSSGKSPSLDPVLRIVRDIEALAMDAARPRVQERDEAIQRARAVLEAWQASLRTAAKNGEAAPEKPLDAIEPEALSLPRQMVTDITVERLSAILRDTPKGLMVFRDEVAGWVESFGRYSGAGGAEKTFWLEAFGGRSFRVDRQSRPEPIIIDRLTVSVLGGVQPDRLTAINGAADDGFAARFLFAWPDPVDGFNIDQTVIASDRQRAALQRLADLALVPDEFAKLHPGFIRVSATAEAHLKKFGAAMKRQANNAVGPYAGVLGKAIVHAIRLSLILEYLWWAETGGSEPAEISEKAMTAALGLMDGYFVPQAKRVFGEASIPTEEQAATAISRWIISTRTNDFNARDARRRIGGVVRDAKTMDIACDFLTEAGVIAPLPNRRGSDPGRPAKDFLVNPLVHQEN